MFVESRNVLAPFPQRVSGAVIFLARERKSGWIADVTKTAERLIEAAGDLRDAVGELRFEPPVTHVYNPLEYAWDSHALYLSRHGGARKKVIFLGMNPGPWGMVQTGVPFGEVSFVRDWVGVEAPVTRPEKEHPNRPVEGFSCRRSEVSGKRLWGLFADRFGSAEAFFADHFVVNYCPLVFMEESGRNRTPDKLPRSEVAAFRSPCDRHLRRVVEILRPERLIGVGGYAEKRLREVFDGDGARIDSIPHPSPANPAANRGWAELATARLRELEVWR